MINRTISYLPDGTRVLSHDPWKPGSIAFVEVKANSDGTRGLIAKDGRVYDNHGYGAFKSADGGGTLAVAWAGPFPNLSNDEIARYYEKLVQVERCLSHSSNPALMVQLTGVAGSDVRCRIIEGINSLPRHGREDNDLNRTVIGHLALIGGELSLSPAGLPTGLQVGDLLISSDFSCEATVNSDKSIAYIFTLESPILLGNCVTTEQLLSLVPDSTSGARPSEYDKLGFTFQSFDIMSAGDVRYQEVAARAKTEPDLGLFLSLPDEKGDCCPVFLTGTGIQLFGHSLYGVEDLLKTPCPPQGVWAFENPQFWAGASQTDIGPEWSQELNGSFVPATPEHMELLGYSMGELGEAILELMRDNRHDISGEPNQVASAWLELAPSYESEPALTL